MIKRFPASDITSIQQAELSAYSAYKSVLETYANRYSHYGVKLNISISRESGGKVSNVQPEIDSTYKAYVICQGIDPNGNIVESLDHDFCFDFAWFLSVYDNGQVSVYDDVDDDVYELMETCDDYFANPY